MTSFTWKKKSGSTVKRAASKAFEDNTKDENDQLEGVDWLTLVPNRKIICLEDAVSKSLRLKDEGSLLAETERYWEAIKKWDEALQFTPLDETLYEMKAQALLALCEVFPAVAMAEKAANLNPTWWTSYQTLGRAQLGLGEVKQALKSFSRAVHLNPADGELWKEDLLWAFSLLKQKSEQQKLLNKDSEIGSQVKVTELDESDCCDHEIILDSDKQVIHKHSIDSTKQNESTEIKRLPKNYVYMRDTP